MSRPEDFDRLISKAMAELGAARFIGPQHAEKFLTQALHHTRLALDHAKRQPKETPCDISSPALPR